MTKPTFQQVRKQHEITLNMLIEDTQVDPSAVLLLDTWGIGEAGIIDTLLESLSRLSGTRYRRDLLNVGGFTAKVNPPYERVAPEVVEESERMFCPSPAAESRRFGVS
jgi:hypothetical protein